MASKDPPLIAAIREFAAKRSHQDSQISNENSRSVAQAAILINGGAATAVIALFSKDRVEQHLLNFVPFALGLYAIGVICGALMIWCMNHALRNWHKSWFEVVKTPAPDGMAGDKQHQRARLWYIASNFSFAISVLCFAGASGVLAYALGTLPPPQLPILPG